MLETLMTVVRLPVPVEAMPPAPAELPDALSPEYSEKLKAFILADLRRKISLGQLARVEDYNNYIAASRLSSDDLYELVQEEIHLREGVDDHPQMQEYAERFGSQFVAWPTLRFAVASRVAKMTGVQPSCPNVGDTFEGFHIASELGRGAFGRVVLAIQQNLAERFVVLKFAPDLEQESVHLARLQHTNIVPIYSYHRSKQYEAVCMPYFGSVTLAHLLGTFRSAKSLPGSGSGLLSTRDCIGSSTVCTTKRSSEESDQPSNKPATPSLPGRSSVDPVALKSDGSKVPVALRKRFEKWSYESAVAWLVARLADGLAHAHERGLLHLDLKPANCLLGEDGQPMLLDFSLSQDAQRLKRGETFVLGGTLPYMAPEQMSAFCRCEDVVDARADLFGLGAILYELLTLRLPFPFHKGSDSTVVATMIEERRVKPTPVRSLNPRVSPALASLTERLLEFDPAKRYQTAAELREDLDRHIEDLPLRYGPNPSRLERVQKWRRRQPYLASALVGAALFLFVGGVGGSALLASRRNADRLAAESSLVQMSNVLRDDRHRLATASLTSEQLADVYDQWVDRLTPFGVLHGEDPIRSKTGRALPEGQRESLVAGLTHGVSILIEVCVRQANLSADAVKRNEQLQLALLLNQRVCDLYRGATTPAELSGQRAALLALLGQTASANEVRATMANQPASALQRRLDEIEAKRTAGDWLEASRLLEALLADAPQLGVAWFLLGDCQERLGKDVDALASYTAAISERATAHDRLMARASLRYRLGDRPGAEKDLNGVLSLSPTVDKAFSLLSQIKADRGDFAGALADLEQAIKLCPKQPRYVFLRSRFKAQAGDKLGSRSDVALGLAITPVDADGWATRAQHQPANRLDQRLADLNEGLKCDPRHRDCLQNKAAVLEQMGKLHESIATLDQAVRFHPSFAPARAGRGVLLARLGKNDEAIRDAEVSLLSDRSPSNLYQVAGIYALVNPSVKNSRETAFRLLSAALRQGFGAQYLAVDHDLDNLRKDPRFDKVVAFASILNDLESSPPRSALPNPQATETP